MSNETEFRTAGSTWSRVSHARRRLPNGRGPRRRRAPLVDLHCQAIHPGDTVTVPAADWSLGTARWMEHTCGTVIAVGRTRVEVRFDGLDHSHHLPSRTLSIVEGDGRH